MTATVRGPLEVTGGRDEEGHREYRITHLVASALNDGPQQVMDASGLYAVGSYWNWGNDTDAWAWCRPEMSISMYEHKKGEQEKLWKATQLFSTKPIDRCQTTSINNPMMEPQKVSGSFVKFVREVTRDKDGFPVTNSSHEYFRGSQLEFDHNKPTVKIEQNTSFLGLGDFSSMVDRVNGVPMWGLGTRRVKLSNVTWQRKIYGSCTYYYTRVFEFDIDYYTFDRVVLDEGTKVLHGEYNSDGEYEVTDIGDVTPSVNNPQHFIQHKDTNGENCRVILNGAGLPANTKLVNGGNSGDPATRTIQYYSEANFFLLGIPTYF